MKKRVLIRAADECKFVVVKCSTDSQSFNAATSSEEPRSFHWLDATFMATHQGSYKGKLVVETNHPDCQRLTIDLQGIARE